MSKITYCILILVGLISCQIEKNDNMIEKYKAEVLAIEKAFAKLAKEKGVKTAFLTFASEEAVLLRGEKLIRGREAISNYFDDQTNTDVKLAWKPDFVSVSSTGDLAYTYGKYKFSATDENGNKIENAGIFHTVWKKEADGKWRFVWD